MSTAQQDRWVEISVQVAAEAADDLVSLFNRHCVGGAIVEVRPDDPLPSDRRVTVKGFLPVWDEQTRQKLEVALLLLAKVAPISPPHIAVLEPENWAESWKAFFPPLHIGTRTVIVPTWHAYASAPGEVVLRLDPGMAFGTGLHATTRLCLAALERYLQPGMQVLDVGTGSGILAIAAALQGAAHVLALDVDPVAVAVARENATRNGVAAVVHVERGTLGPGAPADIPRPVTATYHLLLVNILAEVIIEMAPAIPTALRPAGLLIASGIIRDKADDVVAALAQAGLAVDERLDEDDWVALVAHRT